MGAIPIKNSLAVSIIRSILVDVAEMIDETITLTIDGNAVTISGAQGQKLIVVSLTGRQVAEYQIDSPAQRIELNLTKGCYVLKVGNVVRKVSIH